LPQPDYRHPGAAPADPENLGARQIFGFAAGDGAKRRCQFGRWHRSGNIQEQVCQGSPSEDIARLLLRGGGKAGGAIENHCVAHFGELPIRLGQ